MHEYDQVIVGAGSAGCVMAERLSADPRRRVLLLEAGGSDRSFWIRLPMGYGQTFHDPRVNWRYHTAPDPGTGGRSSYWPRGRVVGGSSSINAMVWCRGLPGDFEAWRAAGNTGWGWEAVRACYQRIERRVDADGRVVADGVITVTDPRRQYHPLARHYFAAAEELGLPHSDDFNGDTPEGVGFYRINTRDGQRCSAADAFLYPALTRANLELQRHALVLRLLFEGRRAVGVEYRQHGEVQRVLARHGVVLCAGAVDSPTLLQRSGVGPGRLLQGHGIPVVLDQPAVGENLQDHLAVSYTFRAREPTLNDVLRPLSGRLRAALQYLLTRRGPLSLSVNQCGGFVRSHPEREHADLQLYVNPLSYTNRPGRRGPRVVIDPFPGFILCFQPCRPVSRGRIRLRSPDPSVPPLIEPNYLGDTRDLAAVLGGGRLLRRMVATGAMRALIAAAEGPDPSSMDDEAIIADFRARCGTVYHPVGTCAMGPDARDSVVDAQLRVHGIDALRVVDASVFPSITSGNTNAPTIMLAWRAAEQMLAQS